MIHMLLRLIRAEQMKLKRSPVWIAFLLMPIVPAVLGTINYLGNLAVIVEGGGDKDLADSISSRLETMFEI